MRRRGLRAVLVIVLVATAGIGALSGCARSTGGSGDGTNGGQNAVDTSWLDIELTDAVTGESYRVADFKGQPVLLHAFAVW